MEKKGKISTIREIIETKGEYFVRLIVEIVSVLCVAIFLLLAALSYLKIFGSYENFYDYLTLAILSGTGIYGGYMLINHRRIQKIERHFPDFVRDLAESKKSGMTFTKAIMLASKGNYGELTPEIRKMARQISWGASVNEALTSFAKRVNTPLINRVISIIVEASRGGGSTADVLEAAAKDAAEIKFLQSERKANMLSYVVIVYVGALAFLAIILILCTQFIPALSKGAATIPGMGGGISKKDVLRIFFYGAMMQAIGSGIVAGVFESGRFTDGAKHAFVLVLITWIFFKIFVGNVS